MIVDQVEGMITRMSTARWYWNRSKTHPTRSLNVVTNIVFLLMDKECIECQVEYSLYVDCKSKRHGASLRIQVR